MLAALTRTFLPRAGPGTELHALMAQSHRRIYRHMTRQFGRFQIKACSNRIPSDVNVLITYKDVSKRRLLLSLRIRYVHFTYPTCSHTSVYAANIRSRDGDTTNELSLTTTKTINNVYGSLKHSESIICTLVK